MQISQLVTQKKYHSYSYQKRLMLFRNPLGLVNLSVLIMVKSVKSRKYLPFRDDMMNSVHPANGSSNFMSIRYT